MYFSKEVILKAFKGLKRIYPADKPKARLERVSALRYFLATEFMLKEDELEELPLGVDSDYRPHFPEWVGEIVAIDDEGAYTKDFSKQFGFAEDYKVGSNFITTQVASSRGRKKTYPGRTAPLLVLNDETIYPTKNAHDVLDEEYNLSQFKVELVVWLMRDLDLEIKSNLTEAYKAIVEYLNESFPTKTRDALTPTIEELTKLIGDIEPILSSEVADISSLSKEPDATVEQMSNAKIQDSDPRLLQVNNAIYDKKELNFLFYGTPGTSKTYYAKEIAKKLTGNDASRMKFIQFHPSVSYDDFVEGFVPEISEQGQVIYKIRPKHFVQFAEEARQRPDDIFVLVIDEISRGDPARIFGEMLTYIETTHRNESFSLTYSAEQFSVPENLIIIATANPHDRSVGELDDAFLRRFFMIEFASDKNLLEKWLEEKNTVPEVDRRKIVHFYSVIDEQLPNGFGHAEFFNIHNIEDMRLLWASKLKFLTDRALKYEPDNFDRINSKYDELFGSSTTNDSVEDNADADAVRKNEEGS